MKIVHPSVKILDWNGLSKNIELGGRLCYKTEDKITEDSDLEFCERMKNFKHFCYSEDTEVLTYSGWKKWADVTSEDPLATMTSDFKLEYHTPIKLYHSKYDGKMYSVENSQVSLLVTPNHRLYVCKTTTLKGRQGLDYKLIEAQDLNTTPCRYIKIADVYSESVGVGLGRDMSALWGFALGDGWVQGNKLYFHLKKDRKIRYLTNLCNNLGLILHNSYSVDYKFSIDIPHNIFTNLKNIDGDKYICHDIPKLSLEECEGLWDGLLNSDGSIQPNSTRFDSTSKILINQVQQLLLHLGISANLLKTKELSKINNNWSDCYTLSINKKSPKPHVNKLRSNSEVTWTNYTGNIYCAEVPNHTLYVRRNGKAVWSGNSTYEHAVITVQIVCDRGVSHELVRHRLAAYSQESTRYCNYSKGKFGGEITVIDPRGAFWNSDGADDETCFRYWMSTMYVAEINYLDLLNQGAKAQEARSVLPNSLKTEILMTANVREWRHIFELRTAREAHPQMRQIMCPLANAFGEKWPVLFGEYVNLGSGIPIPATVEWA